jgi:inhibitor of cysteine peptidase
MPDLSIFKGISVLLVIIVFSSGLLFATASELNMGINKTNKSPENSLGDGQNESQITNTTESEYISGLAKIDGINLERNPDEQLLVNVSGYLSDSCTEIDEIIKQKTGNKFIINITTKRPKDAMCSQVVIPFEKEFKFDISGMGKDNLEIEVNGVTKSYLSE